jgi:putative cell wall-binding protein
MDSRMGNFQNDSQDIYMTKVSFNPSRRVPVRRVRAGSATAFSLALARMTYPGGPEAVLGGTFVTRPWTRIVIVNDQDVAGALAAGVLARGYLAPVLASPASGLPAAVKREVSLMQPLGAYVIGSTSQLSDQVVSDLAAAGVPQDQIVRLAGAGAPGTAAEVATTAAGIDQLPPARIPSGQPEVNAAIIANPASPDAVTAAALAAARRLPILYVSRNAIPPATSAALTQMGVRKTLVIGDQHVVGSGVLAGLPSPTRLGGSNAYKTSTAVAKASLLWGVPDNIVYVTDGTEPMETALLGGALGRINATLLVSPRGPATAQRTIAKTYSLHQDVTQIVAIEK